MLIILGSSTDVSHLISGWGCRHYVPVGPSMQSAVMKYAKDVVQGDLLITITDQGQAVPAMVIATAHSIETGLFNPYTRVRALGHANVILHALECLRQRWQKRRASLLLQWMGPAYA